MPPVRHRTLRPLAALAALATLAPHAAAQSAAPGGRSAAASRPVSDPRVGLKAGLLDAGEAAWNMRLVSTTPPPDAFVGSWNSDLAFSGPYVIQGNFDGIQVWDLSDPRHPVIAREYVCPASQSDVSVYGNLLFVSGEGFEGRLDCGPQGVQEVVSHDRLRGIRIFDITDIRNPRYVANVQTCRGSHTHTVVESPGDRANVYIYVSGSAPVRPVEELPGCVDAMPEDDSTSALFRIEVIRVPLAHPEQAAIVSSPRIFAGLVEPPRHGASAADRAVIEAAQARSAFIMRRGEQQFVLPDAEAARLLDTLVARRGGGGGPTGADSAALREQLAQMAARFEARRAGAPRHGPTQCHDITVYPAVGLAGGACEGYGLLLDIRDPVNPRRIDAVSDSNFSYWHSATLNNDGTKVLFSDEWGGGTQPKCRVGDPYEWGADALFTIEDGKMRFQSYYKLPVPQTAEENCVAHNGALIPIPGRDIMVQAWYQGGISVFDWTDPARPAEIAFFDRGPVDSTRMAMGGSWSVYWYNGFLVSSEIARGLDVFELTPSALLSQNEIDAARTVRLDYLNAQDQPGFAWPASFALARAYVDQLERSGELAGDRIAAIRGQLDDAERASGSARSRALTALAAGLTGPGKVKLLADAVRELAAAD